MKKIIIALFSVSIIMFIAVVMYTFNLIPNNIKTVLKIGENPITTNIKTDLTTNTTSEPAEINQNKIARKITYEEKIKKGDLLKKHNYLTLAIKEYTAASQLKPENAEPYLKIGEIHFQNKTYDKASENFKIALTKNINNNDAKFKLARSYIGENKFKEAEEILKQMPDQNQHSLFYQAILTAYFGDYEKSKELFNKTAQITDNPEIKINTENFLNTFKKYAEAKDAPGTYLKTLLAKDLNEIKEFNLSYAIITSVLKETPDYRDALMLEGYALLNLDKFNESISSFNHALELDPQKPEIRYFLGLAYFGLNRTKEAITELEVALENGFTPILQVEQKLAEMYLIREDYEQSLNYFKKVLNSKNIPVDYFVRPIWISIVFLQKTDEAVQLAKQALEIYPQDAMSFNLLGWAHLAKKEYAASEENLKRALAINPNLGAAYLNLGQMYEETGNIEEAKKNYQKAHELNYGDSIGNLAAQKYNKLLEITN